MSLMWPVVATGQPLSASGRRPSGTVVGVAESLRPISLDYKSMH